MNNFILSHKCLSLILSLICWPVFLYVLYVIVFKSKATTPTTTPKERNDFDGYNATYQELNTPHEEDGLCLSAIYKTVDIPNKVSQSTFANHLVKLGYAEIITDKRYQSRCQSVIADLYAMRNSVEANRLRHDEEYWKHDTLEDVYVEMRKFTNKGKTYGYNEEYMEYGEIHIGGMMFYPSKFIELYNRVEAEWSDRKKKK